MSDSRHKDLEEAQRLIAEECDGVKALLLEKNRKYGNSALSPIRVFSKASPEEQIRVRLDDKITRMSNLAVDETEDVELDLIGYIVLMRVFRRMRESASK